jgi:hypothetical protein
LTFGCVQAPKDVSSANVSSQNDSNLDLSNKTPSNSTISYFDPCAYTTNVLSSDECFLNYAKSKSNVSYCERIYMIDRQDECYENFAPSDSNLCSKLISTQLRSDCYYTHAKLSNNTDLCVKISNTTIKDDCLQKLSPPCSFEPDESSTALCLAIYHNSSSFCKSNDQCLFELGVKNKNHASCLQISNSSVALKSACNAVVNNNISLCNESGIDVVADYCYQLSAYATGNYAWCTLAFSGSQYRANCLTHFASIRNEPSICKFSSSEMITVI